MAQFGVMPGPEFELTETVQVDKAEGSVQTYLRRVDEYLADEEWDEAVDTLRQVMEESGDKLLEVADHHFASVRRHCHFRISMLPPEALALYRSRVDPAARRWYEEGVARRDPGLLLRVVNEAFASTPGDQALYALGEIALEAGNPSLARIYWEKTLPAKAPPGVPDIWLRYPDTDLDRTAVLARLVLASILEGSPQRAKEELAVLAEAHPDARGRLGGRDVSFAQALSALIEGSAAWPPPPGRTGWATFAGSPDHNARAAEGADPAGVAWRRPLRPAVPAQGSILGSGRPLPRVAEDPNAPLSYHPVVTGGLVLVSNQVEMLALELKTGEPAWGVADFYRDPFDEDARAKYNPPNNLGVPRFTLTASEGRLYARMGSAVTSRPRNAPIPTATGYLAAVDLRRQGAIVWQAFPEEPEWAFDGTPVAAGGSVYVAMRHSDIQPQVHVACLDAATGETRWRRFVCASETPARGMFHETTHNLLTLHGDTLYLNTNQGAIAAIAAHDGQLQWITTYPRARQGDLLDPAPHWSRDLVPCVVDRGVLLVAPADTPRILALEAATGQLLWQTGPEVEDAVHLLGTAGDWLVAGGGRLYWIALAGEHRGRVRHVWPDSQERPGYGRGVLAGDAVYWPTRQSIYVFGAATGRMRKKIDLAPLGLTGGNLLISGRMLLVATGNELVALGEHVPADQTQEDTLAAQ